MDAVTAPPVPTNEPVHTYRRGAPERMSLEAKLREFAGQSIDLTMTVGGQQRMAAGGRINVVAPHNHSTVLGHTAQATTDDVADAVDAALGAAAAWRDLPFDERAAIFLRAADLLSTTWRDTLNAATMLGQSKSVQQAEIDSACELIDFLRFNVHFARQILQNQPESSRLTWNRMDYRPLDGFVLAISPFNFTAIGGNLPAAPAMMGNVVVWKPATTSLLANYYFMRILEEAGLPKGVINFVPSRGSQVSEVVLTDPRMSGFHFTGSTSTFQTIWKTVGENIHRYDSYPRLIGETGGKDFVFAHESAQADKVVANLVRGAFEYQGQKCSAA